MEFMIGCNYWDTEHGTNMWRDYDADVIRKDLKALSGCGVKYMRVFPIWRDFQPIMRLYAWQGTEKEYCRPDESRITTFEAIDEERIADFVDFAGICKEYGIKLIVSVVTGWMSGRLFLPRALEGKNPISDPEVLMWTSRFIKGFVSGVKHCDNIVMWDLGNECNCLGPAKSRYEAYVWTTYVRNAIYAADTTRPISSGMHGLETTSGCWQIKDQGEITDYLTPHPYVSRTINNDIDPMNKLRSTMLPTVQCMFYSDISGKPVVLQEQGAFSPALGNFEMNGDFGRINIFSAFAHGVKGWLWWCGASHSNLNNTPYTWSMMERDLGMLDEERKPRIIGNEIRKAGEVIASLPFDELPERETDAVVLLTDDQNHWDNASAAFVLAKQAGFDVKFSQCDGDIPDAKIYILPCIAGWSVINRHAFDTVMDNVKKGAVAYFSYDGGHFFHFEEFTGLTSNGIVKSQTSHTAKFDFGSMNYSCTSELITESVGAQVLAVNEENNIVLSKYALGKGYVYILNMPLERTLARQYNAYNDSDYYKIYKIFAKEVIEDKPIRCENPDIGLTLHKQSDGKYIVTALNYSDKEQRCDFEISKGWTLTAIYGGTDTIGKCNAAFYYLEK